MINLFELKKAQKAALEAAEAVMGADAHVMTTSEEEIYTAKMAEYESTGRTIAAHEKVNTIRSVFSNGQPVVEDSREDNNSNRPAWATAKYRAALAAYLASGGKLATEDLKPGYDAAAQGFKFSGLSPRRSAANYEGGTNSGAPVYQIAPVDTNFIPLAPPEMGISKLALVIPTSMDLPMSRKKAHGVAATKAEGDGTGTNVFTGTSPQTEKFTLSAYMIGHPEDASWELLQDVNTFQQFLVDDILLSIAELKEAAFWAGNADGIQGIKGNTGTGVTGVAAVSGSWFAPLLDATFDVMGDLNPVYYGDAAWLMNRATSVGIRKAQKQANLFEPVFVRVGGQDYLHGFPVEYSAAVDTATAAAKVPVVFGSFKKGYVIGERGGAGVNVKILDQPKALEGLLTILGYQRVDGKIRRSEALQPIVLA